MSNNFLLRYSQFWNVLVCVLCTFWQQFLNCMVEKMERNWTKKFLITKSAQKYHIAHKFKLKTGAWHVGIEKFMWITDFSIANSADEIFCESEIHSKLKRQPAKKWARINLLYVICTHFYSTWNHGTLMGENQHKHTSKWSSKKVMNFWWITCTMYHQCGTEKKCWAFRLISFLYRFLLRMWKKIVSCNVSCMSYLYERKMIDRKQRNVGVVEQQQKAATNSNEMQCYAESNVCPFFFENDHEKCWPWKEFRLFFIIQR